MALAYTVRDRILARWLTTKEDYAQHNVRAVHYLSAEFLMGPYLASNLLNLGLQDNMRQVQGSADAAALAAGSELYRNYSAITSGGAGRSWCATSRIRSRRGR